ncbi:MAG: hypothetical protein Q8P52_01945 [bacterium]|nr:hypothetical protein [bacterium]
MLKRIGFCLVIVFFMVAVLSPAIVFAAQSYTPLAPIPGTFSSDCNGNDCLLSTYLAGAFKLGIAIAGLLAFLMIVIGGFQYATTDSITGKSDGLAKVRQAVGGLILALASYLIIYQINPSLAQLDLSFGGPIEGRDALNVTDGLFLEVREYKYENDILTSDIVRKKLRENREEFERALQSNDPEVREQADILRTTHFPVSLGVTGRQVVDALYEGNFAVAEQKLEVLKSSKDTFLSELRSTGQTTGAAEWEEFLNGTIEDYENRLNQQQ